MAKICSKLGLESFVYSDYPSRLRGGLVTNQVNLSEKPIEATYQKIDLLFALNQEALDQNIKNLNKNALVFYNKDKVKSKKHHALPINELLKDINKQAANSLILGITASLLDIDISLLKKELEDTFKGKKEEIIKQNQEAATIGWNYAKDIKSNFNLKKNKKINKQILTGNEAVALGAVAAGCKFYAAYPMTPATSILHNLANWASKANMIVKHTEDEISAVNMAIGASWGGAKAMVGTSGGGFALMNEGLALSGMTETPLVIVDAQRPGPATGLPTWTGQEDLQYVAKAGHGEFPRIVLAPGSVQEAFSLTIQAFNLADKYQLPVFILMDKYLSESYQTVFLKNEVKIEKGSIVTKVDKDYKRYALTKDGVSPRTLPGTKDGMFIANSDEHDEYGHSIEGFNEKMREEQVKKRFKKNFFKDLPKPKLYGSKKAKTTLVGWGSIKGPVLEAIKEKDINYLHIPTPYPLKTKIPENAIIIENNYTGQLANLLQESLGKKFKRKNKYSGRQFTPEEIKGLTF